MPKKEKCTDHLGNEFNSISAMARYYNISKAAFKHRIHNGWSLKDTLETPVSNKTKKCIDHLGNEFESIVAMCEYHNISVSGYKSRINRGMSIKDALEIPVSSRTKKCTDHLGNEFESITALCNFWKVDFNVYYSRRIYMSYDILLALSRSPFVDHAHIYEYIGEKYYGLVVEKYAYKGTDGKYYAYTNMGIMNQDEINAYILEKEIEAYKKGELII